MEAIYQANGSGPLTVAQLEQELASIPPEAEIQSLTVQNAQRDGWVWSIRAKMPSLPPREKSKINYPPGMRSTGQRADHG